MVTRARLDPNTMPRGGWSPASIAYVLAGKLVRCFYDHVSVEEHASSVTLTMSNKQEFELTITEGKPRDKRGRPCKACKSS